MNGKSRQLIAALSYLLCILHLAISFEYLDSLTSIGVGYATSKMLAAYGVGDLLMIFSLGLRFFRRDAEVLCSVLCVTLSIPFLAYRLMPEFVQSLIGGVWSVPGKYMEPELLAGLDLAVIVGFTATGILSVRQENSGVGSRKSLL